MTASPMYGFPYVGQPTFGEAVTYVTTEEPLLSNHQVTLEVEVKVSSA